TTITDKNGRYSFETVQPGLHLLTIDRSELEINELPSIPQPIQAEVIEDRETTLNFRITRGARLTGQFAMKENDGSPLKNADQNPGNIIIELKSDFKEYRITSDENGTFSFPLVLPGPWNFRIYGNSIPSGFETEKLNFNFDFEPGEEVDLQIELKRKKRNIIFKSDNISLSTKSNNKITSMTAKTSSDENKAEPEDEFFYSVQIGAFSKPVDSNSSFFGDESFDFEKQIDNLYKYYIGRFDSLEKAMEERKKIESKFKGAFAVAFDNGKMIYIE
ncbi:MAG: carboxypeptidase-like regulatory domain-containing protein, partial [Bacteroidota bacterium]